MDKIEITVIIPVYNSSNTIIELNKRIQTSLLEISNDYEIIYINDGSTDDSNDVLIQISNNYQKVNYILLSKNFGQHNAILCGIREAKYDIIITLDDDLQNPPEEIPKLIEKLNEGFDVVYGYPKKEKHGLFRDFASVITKLALKTTMGVEIATKVSSFRAFKTNLRNAFDGYKGSFVSIDVLLS